VSDRALRDLERRAAAEGTFAAWAALLRARLRLGGAPAAWVGVAAQLGDPAARRVLGRFVPVLTHEVLAASVDGWDREACARVAAAFARERPGWWRRWRPEDGALDAAVAAAEAWFAAPADARSGPAARAAAAADALAARIDEAAAIHLAPRTPGGPSPAERTAAAGAARAGVPALAAARAAAAADDAAAREALRQGWEPPAWDAADSPVARLARRDEAERVRAALRPWALRARDDDPPAALAPGLPDPAREAAAAAAEAEAEAVRALEAAFGEALAAEETKARATAIRRRLRAKELERDRVKLAARLGHAPAWLVVKPGEDVRPDLAPPEAGVAMSGRLSEHVARFSKELPRAERRRIAFIRSLYDPEGEGSEPGPAWPDWARELVARVAIGVARVVLPRVQAARPDDPAPAAALEAALAYHLRRDDPAPVEAAAKEASRSARRGPADVRAAGRVVAWVGPLVVRVHDRARQPRLCYSQRDLLGKALEAGLGRLELWTLIREVAAAWATGEDDLGLAARPYAPKASFAEGEAIDHPKFGVGRVVKVAGRKIDVEFEGGRRTLVHAG